MEYRRLGATGLRLPAISLGGWSTLGERLDPEATHALLAAAYDLGINAFDNAETYGDGASETALGDALRSLGWARETFVVSTKVFWGVHRRRPNTWGLSRKHVFEGCHASLRRLGLDHLDLYLCHRFDAETPLGETVNAMSDLVRRGDVLYWGTSEWRVEQVDEAMRIARACGLVPPQAEQLQYNLLARDHAADFGPFAERTGLGITTWSPLAYGLLAGRYDAGYPPGARLSSEQYGWLREHVFGGDEAGVLARVRAFSELAREIGVTPARLALAWVLRTPWVTSAITGASTVAQLHDSVGALDVVPLLDDALSTRIDDVVQPHARAEERT